MRVSWLLKMYLRWHISGEAMKPCKKNLRTMYYAQYSDEIPVYDDKGNPTFETKPGYLSPVKFRGNLSAGNSMADEQPFGVDVSYDRIILVYDECEINVHSLIWVDEEPVILVGGIPDPKSADYEVSGEPLIFQPDGRKWRTERIPIKKRHGNNS